VTEKSPRMLAVFGGAWPLLAAAGSLLLGGGNWAMQGPGDSDRGC
jgi:hypothetical protein